MHFNNYSNPSGLLNETKLRKNIICTGNQRVNIRLKSVQCHFLYTGIFCDHVNKHTLKKNLIIFIFCIVKYFSLVHAESLTQGQPFLV